MRLIILVLILFFSLGLKDVYAITDPLAVPNNQYGIHIVDENDLEKASKLVNSSGGDWGYITLVIPEIERRVDKWQIIFERMRELHLIPIVRLATTLKTDTWEKPYPVQAREWANFLSQLTWVVQNRYIVLFNEPNHRKEWGGDINPEEYAEVIKAFSLTLKSYSSDFFILPAGLDASATNSKETMDEVLFLKRVTSLTPDFFSYIDGWTSHSYPNPAYIGGAYEKGRGTLKTYEWELKVLKDLGLNKKLPVFITETGWPHFEGVTYNKNYYSADKVSELIAEASKSVWTDQENIAAVTPFILNYQSLPFSNFSWQKLNSNEFYPQYLVYQNIAKVSGLPILLTPTPTPTLEPKVLGTQDQENPLLTFLATGLRLMFSYLIKT